MNRENIPVFKD